MTRRAACAGLLAFLFLGCDEAAAPGEDAGAAPGEDAAPEDGGGDAVQVDVPDADAPAPDAAGEDAQVPGDVPEAEPDAPGPEPEAPAPEPDPEPEPVPEPAVDCPALDCDDKDPCNGQETCDPEVGCVPGAPLPGCCSAQGQCEDGNPCNGIGNCDLGTFTCAVGPPPKCSDDNPCNGLEVCDATVGCVEASVPLDCDDGNPCNGSESCDPTLGCIGGAGKICDDGNPCNGQETCDPVKGCGTGSPLACVDGNPCNGEESCDPVTGCVPGSGDPCNDSNPCTLDTCTVEQGCLHVPVACGAGEPCLEWSCEIGAGCVSSPKSCDDLVPCTVDSCKPAAGGCVFKPDAAPCDDEDPCSSDVCDPIDGCVHGPSSGAPCDDDDACTKSDVCTDGTCGGKPVAGCCHVNADCDDGNPCTLDVCNPETTKCSFPFVPDDTPCDADGSGCTEGDRCLSSVCFPGPVPDCSSLDGVEGPCQVGACVPVDAEKYVCESAPGPKGKGCDDGLDCTVSDLCDAAGACAGNPKDCTGASEGPCRPAVCDEDEGGCVTVDGPDGVGCEDGNPCTRDDACDGGECVGMEGACDEVDLGAVLPATRMPALAALPGGGLAATWTGAGKGKVAFRRLDAHGSRVAEESAPPGLASSPTFRSAVTAREDGTAVVAAYGGPETFQSDFCTVNCSAKKAATAGTVLGAAFDEEGGVEASSAIGASDGFVYCIMCGNVYDVGHMVANLSGGSIHLLPFPGGFTGLAESWSLAVLDPNPFNYPSQGWAANTAIRYRLVSPDLVPGEPIYLSAGSQVPQVRFDVAVVPDGSGDFVLGYRCGDLPCYSRYSKTGANLFGGDAHSAIGGSPDAVGVVPHPNGTVTVLAEGYSGETAGAIVASKMWGEQNLGNAPLAIGAGPHHLGDADGSLEGYVVVPFWGPNVDGIGQGVGFQALPWTSGVVKTIAPLSTEVVGDQTHPAAVVEEDGEVSVAWIGAGGKVRLRRFGPDFDPVRTIPEGRANDGTTGDQHAASLLVLSSGDLVVGYGSSPAPGQGDVLARLFDPSGLARAAEVTLNHVKTGEQRDPAIAGAGAGFAAVWVSSLPSGETLVFRAFDAAIAPIGGEVAVATDDPGGFGAVSLSSGPGGLLASWVAGDGDGGHDVRARLFSPDGEPLSELTYLSPLPSPGGNEVPAAAALPDGSFVAAYPDPGSELPAAIQISLHAPDEDPTAPLTPLAYEFLALEPAAEAVRRPALVLSPEGERLALCWEADGVPEAGASRIACAILEASSLLPFAGPSVLLASGPSGQRAPSVVWTAGDRIAIAFETSDPNADGDGTAVEVGLFGDDLTPAAPRFVPHGLSAGDQADPVLALGGGGIWAAWTSAGLDGAGTGVAFRRLVE